MVNNVKRFIPSTFTIDFWSFDFGENKYVDHMLTLRKKIDESDVRGLYINHGIFMETYFWFVKQFGFFYFGDINQKINLTSAQNVAEIVTIAVCNPDCRGELKIFGDELSTKEILDIFNMATGQNEKANCLGSLDDLKNRKWEKNKQDGMMELLCEYLLGVFDGRGRIKEDKNNDFGEVKMTRVADFLKDWQTKGFNYEFPAGEMVKKFEQICGL